MKVMPDTTIRIANSEAVSLELDVETRLGAVRLLPRLGAASEIPLTANAFAFPRFTPPDLVGIEWLEASGSDEAAFVSRAEVVSRHYFSIGELRGYGDGQDDFNDEEKYPDARLWAARQAAEESFEKAAHRSFVRRIGATTDYGMDMFINLDHCDVSRLVSDGYALVSDCQLTRDTGFFGARFPRPIEYVYGLDDIPAKVSNAVLTLAAYYLRPSNTADRATGESSEAGYIHFTLAGIDGATSLPEVNATAEQFGRKGVMVW